ncbi:MAG: rRNA maturation RNase YbeY [Rhodothermales bacterium]
MVFLFDVVVPNQDDLPTEEETLLLVERVMAGESVRWASIGIILAGHELVTELNNIWLSHDYDTDVLSFVVEESEAGLEGEVYVDVETARERCVEFNTTVRQEVARYIVHGLLHLAGHDDATAEGSRLMTALENRYLTPGDAIPAPLSGHVPASG